MRAESMSLLSDPVKPAAFLRWAEIIGIEMPTDLKECVLSYKQIVLHPKGSAQQAVAQKRNRFDSQSRRSFRTVFLQS